MVYIGFIGFGAVWAVRCSQTFRVYATYKVFYMAYTHIREVALGKTCAIILFTITRIIPGIWEAFKLRSI